jgi:hypothetical protein
MAADPGVTATRAASPSLAPGSLEEARAVPSSYGGWTSPASQAG